MIKLQVSKKVFDQILWENARNFKIDLNKIGCPEGPILGVQNLDNQGGVCEVEIHRGHEFMKFLARLDPGFDYVILRLSGRLA